MASVQDRNSVSQEQLDKWTKREQLCLASAVSCSGDQNWMTVSRSLKLLCGTQHPPDWFSQKLCAGTYGKMLENAGSSKRKKRTTSDNVSNVVETPTDLILRRLTEERIQELKSEIREQQETYAKLYTDVVHLQTGNSNEEQIRAMWMEIEREQEQDRLAKARKQMGAQEMQKNLRQGQFQQQKQQLPTTPVKQEQDMEIDETCKPQGTSPLLSSLLKSSSPAPPVATTTTTSTVRVSAPTITNLLTGGIVSASSASSSTASSPSSSQASTLLAQGIPLSKPLTGPGPGDSIQTQPQTVLSPSQSAPTLSMLLEKTKPPRDSPQHSSIAQQLIDHIKEEAATESIVDESVVIKTEDEPMVDDEAMEDGALTPTKEEERQLMEVFKNFIPDNIDELAEILTNNNAILTTGILEEESILDGVESLMDEAQEVDDQLEAKLAEAETRQDSKNPSPTAEDSGVKSRVEPEIDSEVHSAGQAEPVEVIGSTVEVVEEEDQSEPSDDKPKSEIDEKIDSTSSDDSSDNMPLATHTKDAKGASVSAADEDIENVGSVASADIKQSPVAHDGGERQMTQEVFETTQTDRIKAEENEVVQDDEDEGSTKNDQDTSSARKSSRGDSSDAVIIPTDDESNEGKLDMDANKCHSISESTVDTPTKEDEAKSTDGVSETTPQAETRQSPFSQEQATSSPDTDDESSPFETPTTTVKDDRSNIQKQPSQIKRQDSETRTDEESKQTPYSIRKLRDRNRSESPLVDDDTSEHSLILRLRRRYSSNPAMDSIPNSPASSDDREFKVWKKFLMSFYNNLLTNKNAVIFLRPFTEEQNPRYRQVCLRPMDLQIIKRHIENGTIRNVIDFQRDVFLMCNNAIMAFKKNSSYANMARDLMHDFVQLKEQIIDAKMEKDKAFASSSPYTTGVKVRGGARKSQRQLP